MRPQPDPPRLRNWKCRQVYHVYQRGSQRQATFIRPADFVLYLDRLDNLARRYKVRIHAFCLMTNHVHLLLEPLRRGAISRLMQFLQSQHARYMNGLKHTAGHLWHHHFHAKHIANRSQYCETLLYIERNPSSVNLARQAHLYPYLQRRGPHRKSTPAHRHPQETSRTNQALSRSLAQRIRLPRNRTHQLAGLATQRPASHLRPRPTTPTPGLRNSQPNPSPGPRQLVD